MLSDDLNAVAQRKSLIRVGSNSYIKRSMPNRRARRRGDHPPNVPVVTVPQLHPEWQINRDIVEVRVGQLAEQLVHAVIELSTRASQPIGQLFGDGRAAPQAENERIAEWHAARQREREERKPALWLRGRAEGDPPGLYLLRWVLSSLCRS